MLEELKSLAEETKDVTNSEKKKKKKKKKSKDVEEGEEENEEPMEQSQGVGLNYIFNWPPKQHYVSNWLKPISMSRAYTRLRLAFGCFSNWIFYQTIACIWIHFPKRVLTVLRKVTHLIEQSYIKFNSVFPFSASSFFQQNGHVETSEKKKKKKKRKAEEVENGDDEVEEEQPKKKKKVGVICLWRMLGRMLFSTTLSSLPSWF